MPGHPQRQHSKALNHPNRDAYPSLSKPKIGRQCAAVPSSVIEQSMNSRLHEDMGNQAHN